MRQGDVNGSTFVIRHSIVIREFVIRHCRTVHAKLCAMDIARLDSEQTIVAVSTPPAVAERPSLRSIVRLSGPDCASVTARLVRLTTGGLETAAGFSVHRCVLSLDDAIRVPADVYYFRAGRSYTGQEMLELHLPGSTALAERVVEVCVAAGARAAEPGEFTLRAVLSGRIDLTGAEAVAELIAARGDGQLRAAMQLAQGRLTREVRLIADRLADLLAEVEAGLDFADEPLEFITPQRLADELAAVRESVAGLEHAAGSFETLEHRPTVALIGKPNAGKSTLLNRLAGIDRALCSPLPGTTRDVLSAPLPLPDGEALLLDVAGLEGEESGGEAPGTSDLARQSADLARGVAATADLLVVVLDASAETNGQIAVMDWPEIADRPRIVVVNKSDIAPASVRFPAETLAISALTGAGVEALKSAINRRLFGQAVGEAWPGRPAREDMGGTPTSRPAEQLMLNARHRQALADAGEALARAAGLVDQPTAQADLLAGELREASWRLGQISGEVASEDILDRIFSRFCVGK